MTDRALDQGVQAWLERSAELKATPSAPGPDATLATRREHALMIADELARFGTLPVDGRAEIRDITVPTGIGDATARVYSPPGISGPLPTQLFLHGGGFVFGSPWELVNDAVLSRRAVRTGIRYVSLQYALAPEHPYPAARDQAVAVMRHLDREADSLGVDPQRLGIGGNSAGASLAASAALVLVRGEDAVPHHVALEVPAVSIRALEQAAQADAETAAQVAEYPHLLAAYAPAMDDDAFIADDADLSAYPPTLLMLAEHDLLRSGGERLARRLNEAGRDVELHVMPGHVHASPGVTALSPAATDWQYKIDRSLRYAYRAASDR